MPDTMIQTPIAATTLVGMPPEVAAAIIAVMAGIGKLAKVERNPHDKYDFVSVDGFLSAVNPLCAEHGLVIIQDEESVDFVERQGRNGASTWVRITYSFTIAHVSGVVLSRQPRRTVMTIANGAQAFGSAQSYALKQFMRSLFQIATGDKDDPDFQQCQDIGQARQKPVQTPQQPPRTNPTPAQPAAAQEAPSGMHSDQHLYIQEGASGLLVGTWVKSAKKILDGMTSDERRDWLEAHMSELDDVRNIRPDWADRLVSQVVAPDQAEAAE